MSVKAPEDKTQEYKGRVLIIAGSDSGGGAGIQADLKTVTMLGGYAMTAITAITVQNTLGVSDVVPVPTKTIVDQMVACLSDIGADAIKTGMLGTIDVVETVAEALDDRAANIITVIDPVMVAKGGHPLLENRAIDAVRTHMVPRAGLLSPNAPEAAALCGFDVDGINGQRRAAEKLLRLGAKAVLIKGGHLGGPVLTDLLATHRGEEFFESEKILTTSTHGTGCTMASAIAALLAQGMDLTEAVGRAQNYVHQAILHAKGLGQGHGPLNHNYILA